MKPLFSSNDDFKAATAEIAQHLKNTKLGVLRTAIAKAHGFRTVPAYQASLDKAARPLSRPPMEDAEGLLRPNPNIYCRHVGNQLHFQGRLPCDGDPSEAPHRDGPDRLCVDERTFGQWDSNTQKVWGQWVSQRWTGKDLITQVTPVTVEGELYARGHCDLSQLRVDTRDDLIHLFLSRQPEHSALEWVMGVLMVLFRKALYRSGMSRLVAPLCDQVRKGERTLDSALGYMDVNNLQEVVGIHLAELTPASRKMGYTLEGLTLESQSRLVAAAFGPKDLRAARKRLVISKAQHETVDHFTEAEMRTLFQIGFARLDACLLKTLVECEPQEGLETEEELDRLLDDDRFLDAFTVDMVMGSELI